MSYTLCDNRSRGTTVEFVGFRLANSREEATLEMFGKAAKDIVADATTKIVVRLGLDKELAVMPKKIVVERQYSIEREYNWSFGEYDCLYKDMKLNEELFLEYCGMTTPAVKNEYRFSLREVAMHESVHAIMDYAVAERERWLRDHGTHEWLVETRAQEAVATLVTLVVEETGIDRIVDLIRFCQKRALDEVDNKGSIMNSGSLRMATGYLLGALSALDIRRLNWDEQAKIAKSFVLGNDSYKMLMQLEQRAKRGIEVFSKLNPTEPINFISLKEELGLMNYNYGQGKLGIEDLRKLCRTNRPRPGTAIDLLRRANVLIGGDLFDNEIRSIEERRIKV